MGEEILGGGEAVSPFRFFLLLPPPPERLILRPIFKQDLSDNILSKFMEIIYEDI